MTGYILTVKGFFKVVLVKVLSKLRNFNLYKCNIKLSVYVTS